MKTSPRHATPTDPMPTFVFHDRFSVGQSKACAATRFLAGSAEEGEAGRLAVGVPWSGGGGARGVEAIFLSTKNS